MLQRYSLVTVALLILIGIAYVRFSPSPAARVARPTTGQNIIAFGDSLVSGAGTTEGGDFVSRLSHRLNVPIINAGRNGETTATGLARLDRAVLSRSPKIVIVLLGGNDFLRRVPRENTFKNLATIVERIRQRGSAVILVGISVGLLSDEYEDGYKEIARSASAGLVPDILTGIIGHADLMADPIHPNDRGHEMIADRLEPMLRELVQGR